MQYRNKDCDLIAQLIINAHNACNEIGLSNVSRLNNKGRQAGDLYIPLFTFISYGATEITPNVPARLLLGPAVK
jgi:hypothetical protein